MLFIELFGPDDRWYLLSHCVFDELQMVACRMKACSIDLSMDLYIALSIAVSFFPRSGIKDGINLNCLKKRKVYLTFDFYCSEQGGGGGGGGGQEKLWTP